MILCIADDENIILELLNYLLLQSLIEGWTHPTFTSEGFNLNQNEHFLLSGLTLDLSSVHFLSTNYST